MNIWTVLNCFLKINYLINPNFFSSLRNECISKKIYLHANNVWNMFKMNIMADCHHLFLKTDVLLLANVFGKFISHAENVIN